MKKETICIECNNIPEINYFCDTCSDNLIAKYRGIPITINFSYGHDLDGEEYHFCNNECLLIFINEEFKKGE
jgi:YHS domain-containing protein